MIQSYKTNQIMLKRLCDLVCVPILSNFPRQMRLTLMCRKKVFVYKLKMIMIIPFDISLEAAGTADKLQDAKLTG